MVYVGSARIDENGQSTGGMPGDQTGQECMVEISKQNACPYGCGCIS